MKNTIVRIECKGDSLFLMKGTQKLLKSLRGRVSHMVDLSPKEEAEQRLIKRGGKIGIPADHLLYCLLCTDQLIRNGNGQKSASNLDAFKKLLRIKESFLPFTNGGQTWKVDMRRGVDVQNGNDICIFRPIFKNWGFNATLLLNPEKMQPDTVRNLLINAGIRVGLGDYRPFRGGRLGRFRLVKFEVKE